MIDLMKRHEVQVLRKAGLEQKEIAKHAGVSERSVRRILGEEPVVANDDRAARKACLVGRPSKVTAIRPLVEEILKQREDLPGVEILRLVRLEGYTGGKTALYDLVRSVRKVSARPIVRFEGVAGEFSQHDFGSVTVEYLSGKTDKVHFFASRLKYSRFAHVAVTPDERVESVVRSLIRAFDAFGGVPLVGVFDNPKTVVLSRKENEIEWNRTFGQAALDLRFAPELCWPRSPRQKGAVENLVGWVKSSFFKVRRFQDRADLEAQLAEWLRETNETRPSRATGVTPLSRLAVERERLRPLPVRPEEYALRFPVVVGPTAFVEHDGIRYSMPPQAIGIPGTLFLFPDRVRIVAARFERDHPRFPEDGKTSYHEEDRAATLAAVSGERAQLYLKRQQLLELGEVAEHFLTEIVHRHPRTWRGDVEDLHDLLVKEGPRRLLVAIGVATKRRLFGADCVAEILKEEPFTPRLPLEPVALAVGLAETSGASDADGEGDGREGQPLEPGA